MTIIARVTHVNRFFVTLVAWSKTAEDLRHVGTLTPDKRDWPEMKAGLVAAGWFIEDVMTAQDAAVEEQ